MDIMLNQEHIVALLALVGKRVRTPITLGGDMIPAGCGGVADRLLATWRGPRLRVRWITPAMRVSSLHTDPHGLALVE